MLRNPAIRKLCLTVSVLGLTVIMGGCGSTPPPLDTPVPVSEPSSRLLKRLGWTIQAGAFSNVDNAVRFTEKLQNQGLDAYHFIDESRLYKVRFGNYTNRLEAEEQARTLVSEGVIEEFYIVNPQSSAAARYGAGDGSRLRDEIIKTAARFKGTPYRWGGTSAREGFDCSGFTMTVYRLNGLDLPRSSRSQWHAGESVNRTKLEKGNLVFFRTNSSRKISHVGIYDGNGRFIHAPGKGKKVRRSSLDNRYYKKRYAGAKTYF